MTDGSVGPSSVHVIRKVRVDGGEPVAVRDDNAIGCSVASDGSALYYARILRQAGGGWDFGVRAARPESGPSTVIGRVAASRVPATAVNFQVYLSPDGQSLATPLIDGSTTNLWTLSVKTGEWRRLTDFGARNVVIARRIAWSRDGRHIYASVADVDSDIVMLAGLRSCRRVSVHGDPSDPSGFQFHVDIQHSQASLRSTYDFWR